MDEWEEEVRYSKINHFKLFIYITALQFLTQSRWLTPESNLPMFTGNYKYYCSNQPHPK